MFEVVTGRLNRARVLTRLAREGIRVKEVSAGRALRFLVSKNDVKKIRELLPQAKIRRRGLSTLLNFFLSLVKSAFKSKLLSLLI